MYFGDAEGLAALARQLSDLSDSVDGKRANMENAVGAVLAATVGAEAEAASTLAGRWSDVGGSLKQVAYLASDISGLIATLGSRLASAAQDWSVAEQMAEAVPGFVTVHGSTVTVTAAPGASASDVSAAHAAEKSLEAALSAAWAAWRQAAGQLDDMTLPELDDFAQGASFAVPQSGNTSVDYGLRRLVPALIETQQTLESLK